MQLASRFASRSPALRSEYPLTDDQIHRVAPSIFADAPHESRSQRYAYIPTAAVLTELRKEGFQPFMVTQTRVRDEGKREHTKHMLRLRHASQINGAEANEIVLLNSHDGTSSYQMLAGMFRFVCSNGLVCGEQQTLFSLSGEMPCNSHPASLPVPRRCAAITRCPMTRFAAWPRPSSRTPRMRAVPSGTATSPPRPC
jgi:hypothetical protein